MGLTEHHISRRDVIKKGAVAGAILWSAPVIESVTSRAAAGSHSCTSTGSFNASYVFVVFTNTVNGVTTTYFTGINSSGCGQQNANNQGDFCVQCGGVYYYLHTFSGSSGTSTAITTSTVSCSAAEASTTSPTYVDSTTCGQYLTVSNGTVSAAQPGVQILVGFCAGANSVTGSCATMESSQGCTYATCG
ncbi:MAG TPA: hypothetical protein VG184_06940 [Acidimicrobiales bacterium]|jgi:hypothetical protein|nr:hypothetical protein [Acidimicrobiales bacterium]